MTGNPIKRIILTLAATVGVVSQALPAYSGQAVGIGVVTPMPAPVHRIHVVPRKSVKIAPKIKRNKIVAPVAKVKTVKKAEPQKKASAKKAAMPKAPQEAIVELSSKVLTPGVVHKCHRGALNINILDVDLNNPNIEVKPVLAGETFNRLDEVKDQAHKVNAIAAINANYFKKDGTPLGTLVIDGEWISGPLYDRISFGITNNGSVHVDRANLHGVLETSNPELKNLWVNNINQPRRHGCKIVAYTRRWGSQVKMPYPGSLVAVDASGRVVDKAPQIISVPYGGFVLSDTKYSVINKLERGDLVSLDWQEKPESWADVLQAVSGGPALIKNGKLFVDLKDENFRKTWTSSSIHARTALGVTRNNHLILATIEGPHTLWDVAKMLHRLGCVEAMNLDGGGSTTMVIGGQIVTRNKNTFQRRVAASLAIVPRTATRNIASRKAEFYEPQSQDLSSLMSNESDPQIDSQASGIADPLTTEAHEAILDPNPARGELLTQSDLEKAKPVVQEVDEPKKKKQSKSRFSWMKKMKLGDILEKLPSLPNMY